MPLYDANNVLEDHGHHLYAIVLQIWMYNRVVIIYDCYTIGLHINCAWIQRLIYIYMKRRDKHQIFVASLQGNLILMYEW